MKKLISYLLIILLGLSLHGCAELLPASTGGDFYMKLSGNYELEGTSPDNIFIKNNTVEVNGRRVDSKVIEIVWNDKYILAKRIPFTQEISGQFNNIKETDEYLNTFKEEDMEYWIIEVESDKIYGALNKEDFINKKNELSIPNDMELKSVESYRELFYYTPH